MTMKIKDPELGIIDLDEGLSKDQLDFVKSTNSAQSGQTFSEVKEEYDKLVARIGIEPLVEFNKAVNAGNKERAMKLAKEADAGPKLKAAMIRIAELMK